MRPTTGSRALYGWEDPPMCALCHANGPLERHHAIFRSQGGGRFRRDPEEPGGTPPDRNATNLVTLCKVCHDACHGIATTLQDHSCRTCPVRRKYGCHFGEKVLGLPVVTAPPWRLLYDAPPHQP